MLLEEFNELKEKVSLKIVEYANQYFYYKRHGIEICTEKFFIWKKLLLYGQVLDTWEQSPTGDTTGFFNYITDEQFVIMTNDIKKIVYAYN